ncbi:MAG TPA: YkvA family protein [Gammaproteobacteria bacterium]|nr:YkvA family protein [Gammaproteobacteria bacterium]
MPLKLTLTLSDADLEHYRQVMDETWQRHAGRDEKEIRDEARALLQKCETSDGPDYVRMRLADLGTLIAMLEDEEWSLEQKYRGRVIAALSYFADPKDLIPDSVPGLGFFDDALMTELVIRELKHELDAYRDFCKYREQQESVRGKDAPVKRAEWLASKRRQLMMRIERRQQERRRHYSNEAPTDPILRYQY